MPQPQPTNGQLLGVVLLARHGDRDEFFQDPTTYDPANTTITKLGLRQANSLGQFIQQRYLNPSSPTFIPGVNPNINASQIVARADAGGEGAVILASSAELLKGLTKSQIPLEAVEPQNDVSLEGWTDCGTFDAHTTAFYNSPVFKQKAAENADFLKSLKPLLDDRPDDLENMWNIFDFLNVNFIHDPDFRKKITPSTLAQAHDLANFHEHGVFTDTKLGGIGNIAGRTILPSMLNGLARVADPNDGLKIFFEGISYKPFLSLFHMVNIDKTPELAGIVEYVAAMALEVRSSSHGPVLRLQFKNGTEDKHFRTLNMFDASGDTPLSTFVNRLSGVTINDTATWCQVCQNTQDRGCDQISLGARTLQARHISLEETLPINAERLLPTVAQMGAAFVLVAALFLYVLNFTRRGTKAQHAK